MSMLPIRVYFKVTYFLDSAFMLLFNLISNRNFREGKIFMRHYNRVKQF